MNFAELLVKRLLPLGFTRADIRKEFFTNDRNPNAAALKLLDQQVEARPNSPFSYIEMEDQVEQKPKVFAIYSIQV